VALRPYALKTQDILGGVAESMRQTAEDEAARGDVVNPEDVLHPLLAIRPAHNILFLVLTSDRGLCGAFNANVNKAAEREWRERRVQEGVDVKFATVGRKGREYLQRRGATIEHDFVRIYDGLDLAKSRLVSEWIVSRFEHGEIDAVYVVYNEFKSAITQKVAVEQLLPIPKRAEGDAPSAAYPEYLYEPNPRALLERLVPMYIEISLYRALLESQASEFGARMTAMDAATRNAKDMISRLTLQYNRARQAAITKELMEIIGGAEALKE
jgi:F-type H+-transporting ATPase subunit gamma